MNRKDRIASNQMLLNFGRTRYPGRSSHETGGSLATLVGKTRRNASANPICAFLMPAPSALLIPALVRTGVIT